MTWKHPTNVDTEFKIYRDVKSIDTNNPKELITKILTNDLNEYSYNDEFDMKPNTDYFYRINSISQGSNLWSDEIIVKSGNWEIPKILTPIFEWHPDSRGVIQDDNKTIISGSGNGWTHIYSKDNIKSNIIKQYIEIDVVDFGRRYPDSLQIGVAEYINWGSNAGDNGKSQFVANGTKRKDGSYSQFSTPYTSGDILGFCVYINQLNNTVVDAYKNGEYLGQLYDLGKASSLWIVVSSYDSGYVPNIVKYDDLKYLPDDAVAWGTINEI